MDILIKQTRSRSSDAEKEHKEERSSPRDGKITPQKRESFRDTDVKGLISTSASKKITEKEVGPAPSIKKKPTFAYTDPNNIIIDHTVSPEKAAEPVPSMGRHPTSVDKQISITGSETPETTARIPDRPPTIQSTGHPVETKKQIPTEPGSGDTKADAWEKAEMARIKERYEKLIATIQNWETKKKKNSKRKLDSVKVELDKKREKAIQKYHTEMRRIEEIAQRETTKAQKNRRNEEFKVKEKASKFRSTGKLPATCMCF